MEIHIERAGKRYGPYSEAEARKYLQSGILVAPDLAWQKGSGDWVLLAKLFPTVQRIDGSSAPVGVPPRASGRYRRPLALAVLVLALVAYGLSPYFALWRLYAALKSGNHANVETRIDFPSVRAGLKEDLRTHFAKSAGKDADTKENPFAGLVSAIVPTLLDGVIDSMVTPSGIASLVTDSEAEKPTPNSTEKDAKSGGEQMEWSQIHYAFFTSPTKFLVDVEGVKLRMQLVGTSWKVTRVEVSPEKLESALN